VIGRVGEISRERVDINNVERRDAKTANQTNKRNHTKDDDITEVRKKRAEQEGENVRVD
jgi:hypothetical protein